MNIIRLVLGLFVLFFGRNLFWLFVAVVGFLGGMDFAAIILTDQPIWISFLIGGVCGIFGAVLAVVFQRVAFAVAGYFSGSLLAIALMQNAGSPDSAQVAAIMGGLVAAVIAFVMMDWALVVLSSLVGAAVIATELESLFNTPNAARAIAFVVLAILGISFQASQLKLWTQVQRVD